MAITVLAAFLSLAAQGQPITGLVLKPDGTPAGGATVRMYRLSDAKAGDAETVADANGRFEFAATAVDARPLVANLVAQSPGSAIGFATFTPLVKKLTITLGTPTQAVVTFLGPDGKPVAGVAVAPRVLIQQRGSAFKFLSFPESLKKGFTVRTDAKGQATLAGLPQDFQCEVEVLDDRFAQLDYRNRFPLGSGSKAIAPPIKLQRGGFMSGQVVLDGRPVPGIEVMAQGVRGNGYGTATTDAQGRFRMARLSPAGYNVGLNLDDKWSEDYTARAFEVALVEGEEKKDLTFKLEKGAIVTGKVLRPDGKPAANVPVGVYGPARPRSGGWVQSSMTDDQGIYRLRVPAGEQFVYVQLEGNGMRTLQVKDGESAEVDFRLTKSPEPTRLAGTVRDPEGKPVAGATVEVRGKERNNYQRADAETDEHGRFEILIGSPADELVLEARKGELYATEVEPKAAGDTEIRTARVGVAAMAGGVHDTKGKPVVGASVVLYRWRKGSGNSVDEVKTDVQGKFRFEGQIPGQEYSISVTAVGYGRRSGVHTTPKKGETMTIAPVALVKADQPLMGRVVDEAGKPVAGVEVNALSEEQSTSTDHEGRFRFTGLPKGAVSVMAIKGGMYVNRSLETGRVEYELVLKRADDSIVTRPSLTPIAVGQAAPELEATNWVNGQATSLKALRGQIVVLDFWAIWCGPCREELPKVRAMAESFKGKPVKVIGLHDASTWPKELKAFAAKNKMTYLLGIDRKEGHFGFGQTADRYGVDGIPTVVVIDREGRVASVSNDAETARATVERLLKGK